MALTEIDGTRQIQDLSIGRAKMLEDFLGGVDWNISNSNNNATITGLAAGTGTNDAVNKGQMDAAIATAISGAMKYKGTIDASDPTGAALDGAATGDFYVVSVAGTLDGIAFSIGDHLVVNANITDFDVDGAGKIDVIDNSEANDILRDADIIDDLITGGTDKVLSAQQGVVLKGLVDDLQLELNDTQTGAGLGADGSYTADGTADYISTATSLKNADSLLDDQIKVNADAIASNDTDILNLQNAFSQRVFAEEPSITVGNAVLGALANFPVDAGTARVYINGMRARAGAGNDYTINEATGVITLGFLPKVKDIVLVDYEY